MLNQLKLVTVTFTHFWILLVQHDLELSYGHTLSGLAVLNQSHGCGPGQPDQYMGHIMAYNSTIIWSFKVFGVRECWG